MIIKTKYLDEMEIEESRIIHVPAGLPGFPEEKEYVLLELPANPMFHILQSVNEQHLAFILTDPYQIYGDYSIQLDNSLLESLEIKDEKEVAVFSVVTLKDPFPMSTINLKAPIVINTRSLIAKQYILNTDAYSSKSSIRPPVNTKEGK